MYFRQNWVAPASRATSMQSESERADMVTMPLDPASENQRASAFAWLMEDPEHRAIQSPGSCDAVLNLYAAREAYPDAHLTCDQFSYDRLPSTVDREIRILPLHLWTF